jgi:hypothetical protein
MLKMIFIRDNIFEDAIEENIRQLKEKITFSQTKHDELSIKTSGKEYSTLASVDFDLIDEECVSLPYFRAT